MRKFTRGFRVISALFLVRHVKDSRVLVKSHLLINLIELLLRVRESRCVSDTSPVPIPGVQCVHAAQQRAGLGEINRRLGGEAHGHGGPGAVALVAGDRRRLPGCAERHQQRRH